MTEHLSAEDIERIRAFANQPRHKREPEQLMPANHDEE
jgi:hypothetical protein